MNTTTTITTNATSITTMFSEYGNTSPSPQDPLQGFIGWAWDNIQHIHDCLRSGSSCYIWLATQIDESVKNHAIFKKCQHQRNARAAWHWLIENEADLIQAIIERKPELGAPPDLFMVETTRLEDIWMSSVEEWGCGENARDTMTTFSLFNPDEVELGAEPIYTWSVGDQMMDMRMSLQDIICIRARLNL